MEELIVDLNQLKSSFHNQGIDLDDLKTKYNEYKRAKIFLRRNKNLAENDPRRLTHTQTIQQNNESFKKYTRIENLQKKITRLRQKNRPRILQCHNCNRRSPSNVSINISCCQFIKYEKESYIQTHYIFKWTKRNYLYFMQPV